MKKLFVVFSVLLPMLAVVSCKKEGVYSPDKKISEIHIEATVTERDATGADTTYNIAKYKAQEWTWEGNLLTAVTSFDQTGARTAKQLLTYDGKKLVKVADESGKYYTQYGYKNGKLTTIATVSDGTSLMNADVIHDGGKISKLKFAIDLSDFNLDDFNFAKKSLGYVMPEKLACVLFSSSMAKSKAGQPIEVVVNLTYVDDNVTKMTVSYSGLTAITVNCTYDKKHNPKYGNYADIGPSALSKNNICEISVSGLGASAAGGMIPQNQVCAYTYTDDDYPATMTTSTVETLENSATRTTRETDTYVYGD